MKKFLLMMMLCVMSVVGAWAQIGSYGTDPNTATISADGSILKIKGKGNIASIEQSVPVTTTTFTSEGAANVVNRDHSVISVGDVYNSTNSYSTVTTTWNEVYDGVSPMSQTAYYGQITTGASTWDASKLEGKYIYPAYYGEDKNTWNISSGNVYKVDYRHIVDNDSWKADFLDGKNIYPITISNDGWINLGTKVKAGDIYSATTYTYNENEYVYYIKCSEEPTDKYCKQSELTTGWTLLTASDLNEAHAIVSTIYPDQKITNNSDYQDSGAKDYHGNSYSWYAYSNSELTIGQAYALSEDIKVILSSEIDSYKNTAKTIVINGSAVTGGSNYTEATLIDAEHVSYVTTTEAKSYGAKIVVGDASMELMTQADVNNYIIKGTTRYQCWSDDLWRTTALSDTKEKLVREQYYDLSDGDKLYVTGDKNYADIDNNETFFATNASYLYTNTETLTLHFNEILENAVAGGAYTDVVFEKDGGDITIDPAIVKAILESNTNTTSLDLSEATITTITDAFALTNNNTALTTLKLPASLSDGSDIDVNAIKVTNLAALTTLDMSASKLTVETKPDYGNTANVDVLVPAGISSATDLNKYLSDKSNAIYSLSEDGAILYALGKISFANADNFKGEATTFVPVTDKIGWTAGEYDQTTLNTLQNLHFNTLDLSNAGGVYSPTITVDNISVVKAGYTNRYGTSAEVTISGANITYIDASGADHLGKLIATNNANLTTVNLSGISYNDNAGSTDVNLSGNTALASVATSAGSRISDLKLTGCTALTSFDAEASFTGSIYLDGCSSLASVDVSYAEFTAPSTSKIYVRTAAETSELIATLKTAKSIVLPNVLSIANVVPALTGDDVAFVEVVSAEVNLDAIAEWLTLDISGETATITAKKDLCGMPDEKRYWKAIVSRINGEADVKTVLFSSGEGAKKTICTHITREMMNVTNAQALDYMDVQIDELVGAGIWNSSGAANPDGTFIYESDNYKQNNNITILLLPEIKNADSHGHKHVPVYCGARFPNLELVVMPNNATCIEHHAFTNMATINTVILNDGLKMIGHDAFDAARLNTLSIPDGLEYVGINAFGAGYLHDVYFLGKTAPIVEMDAFGSKAYLNNNAVTQASFETEYKATRDNYVNNDYMAAMMHLRNDLTSTERAAFTDITRDYHVFAHELTKNGVTVTVPSSNPSIEFKRNLAGVEGDAIACNGNQSDDSVIESKSFNVEGANIIWAGQPSDENTYCWQSGYYDKYVGTNYRWPSQADATRAYSVATNSLTWNGIKTIADYANATEVSYDSDCDGTADRTFEAGDQYIGLHQFILVTGDVSPDTTPQEWDFNTIGGANWYTICVPVDMTAKQVRTAFGETTQVCKFNKVVRDVTDHVKFYFTDEQCLGKDEDFKSVEANEAYMIRPSHAKDADYKFTLPQYTLSPTQIPIPTVLTAKASIAEDAADVEYTYTFIGQYNTNADGTYLCMPQYSYYLGADKSDSSIHRLFMQSGKTGKWKPFTCVIIPSDPQSDFETFFDPNRGNKQQTAKGMSVAFGLDFYGDNATTSIDYEIICGAENAPSAVYNLNGQYVGNSVSKLAKGIYVKNGKKFIVK